MFVLHSHLPYARLAGRWPHGEEWIHEAASETYIPLLETLYDLVEEGVKFRLNIGITPVLTEQLADPLILEHFDQYLADRIAAAKRDMLFFSGLPVDGDIDEMLSERVTLRETEEKQNGLEARHFAEARAAQESDARADAPEARRMVTTYEPVPTAEPHLRYLAEWYKVHYENVRRAFNNRFNRDIVGAFKRLQDDGYIEIVTSAATHPYLPLLGRDSTIRAQIQVGISSYIKHYGRRPASFWLPECAYRPAYFTRDGVRVGIEQHLAEHDLRVFFAETHTITGGQPVGVATGEMVGPYGQIRRRYVVPSMNDFPKRDATTFQAYYVSDTAAGEAALSHSGVAVIGRNAQTGQQVWSSTIGYPGDFDYREFHKKAGTSGLKYWRVTGAKLDLAHKDYYHPDWAAYKVEQHAEHFAHLVSDQLREYHAKTGEQGVVMSSYDTELFGHWWYEGVLWLEKVLRHLANDPSVKLQTASEYITEHPPRHVLHIPESSWGAGGNHFTWNNTDNRWMWAPIHEAEVRLEGLVIRYPNPTEDERFVLNQIAREALLLQSSDWPFLVTTGQARDYAIQRFNQHLERFTKLADSLDRKAPDRALAEQYWELDKAFYDIDYRWFRSRS
jgi:1,4-alpha-glucan branching enzyme